MREGWSPVTTIRLVRHRQTKGAETDRPDLRARDACSLIYLAPALSRVIQYKGSRDVAGGINNAVLLLLGPNIADAV